MCSKALLNELLQKLTDHSKKVFGDDLKNVILYGSYARGDYDDESDIDVMIMVDLPMNEIWSRRKEINHFCSQLNMEYSVFISPMLQNVSHFNKWKDTMPFYRNVSNEGVRVYG